MAKRNGRVLHCPMLFSFAYLDGLMPLLGYLRDQDLVIDEIFLDSGAYSIAMKGIRIDLEEYAGWVRLLDRYSRVRTLVPTNLDVIPTDAIDLEKSAGEGWRNYLRLKELGVDSIPVLHYGESLTWLDKMLNQTDYVGLGGVSKNNVAKNRPWFDKVFSYLDRHNVKGLKVHGYGTTAPRMLVRYPWHSVDSSTANKVAGVKKCFLPKFVNGRAYDFTRPWCLEVCRWEKSDVPPRSMDRYLRSIGFRFEDVFDRYKRIQINVVFFQKLLDQIEHSRN